MEVSKMLCNPRIKLDIFKKIYFPLSFSFFLSFFIFIFCYWNCFLCQLPQTLSRKVCEPLSDAVVSKTWLQVRMIWQASKSSQPVKWEIWWWDPGVGVFCKHPRGFQYVVKFGNSWNIPIYWLTGWRFVNLWNFIDWRISWTWRLICHLPQTKVVGANTSSVSLTLIDLRIIWKAY